MYNNADKYRNRYEVKSYFSYLPYDIDSIFSSHSTSFQKGKTTLHKKHYDAHDHFEKSIYVDFQDIKWLFEFSMIVLRHVSLRLIFLQVVDILTWCDLGA